MVLTILLSLHFGAGNCLAAFGEDVEKPKPVFSKEGSAIFVKLLPRGKSKSIRIRFEVTGGDLADIQAMDLPKTENSDIDKKDFRSDLFTVHVANVPVGGEVTILSSCDYYTSATRFYVFNEKAASPWSDTNATNKSLPDRVQDLTFSVKDGGPYDADGTADGKITVNCGPWDSFWGYAVGTLFIRFFGVFLVLGVLQTGMIICGKLFERADKRRKIEKEALVKVQVLEASRDAVETVSATVMEPEMVAAISLALHLEVIREMESGKALDSDQSAWNLYGRQKIMSDRLLVFNRHTK